MNTTPAYARAHQTTQIKSLIYLTINCVCKTLSAYAILLKFKVDMTYMRAVILFKGDSWD